MKGRLIATTKTFSIVSLPNWRISTIRFGTRGKRHLSFARWGNKRKRHGCCGSLEVWSTGGVRANACTTCSRRTVPKMCFCSWYPPRCYQHRGLLPSYLFLNSGCKTTIFSWFCRYARYSSLRNLIPPKFAFSLKL